MAASLAAAKEISVCAPVLPAAVLSDPDGLVVLNDEQKKAAKA